MTTQRRTATSGVGATAAVAPPMPDASRLWASLASSIDCFVTVIDPDAAWSVDPASGRSKSRNTPFAGRALRGRAVHVFVDGDHRLGAA